MRISDWSSDVCSSDLLVIETFGEQRADRTVDQAADQSFLFGRAAFALEEAAGDTVGRRIFFLIVDGEREEILPVLHRLGGSDGAEHNRLAQARDDRDRKRVV